MRTTIKAMLFTALALLGSGCATRENRNLTEAQALAAAEEGQIIRECRYAKSTGSKMRTRICYSQETWAALDAANEEEQDTDDFFRHARENSTTGVDIGYPQKP